MWKTSKWTLHAMQFFSPRGLKASLSSGPLEITLVVVHFHHKHRRRQLQWKEIAKEMHGPNPILYADHNSLIVQHWDAFAPPKFEYDTSLRAREEEVATLANVGLHDVWVDMFGRQSAYHLCRPSARPCFYSHITPGKITT